MSTITPEQLAQPISDERLVEMIETYEGEAFRGDFMLCLCELQDLRALVDSQSAEIAKLRWALEHVVANDNLTPLKMLDMDGIRAALRSAP